MIELNCNFSNVISLSRKSLCQSRIQTRDFKTTTFAFHSNLKGFPLSSSGLLPTKQTKSNHLNKRQKIYLPKQVSDKNHSQLTSVKLKYQTLYKNIAGTLFINFFFNLYFYFILLYNTVLVLPYIDMNPPRVYMSSQS